jgi:hypothetical protein
MKKLCIIAIALLFSKTIFAQEFPLKQREIGTIGLLLDGKSKEALQFFAEKIFIFEPEYLHKGIHRVYASRNEGGNLSLDLIVYTATDSCGFMVTKYNILGADKYVMVTKYNLVTKEILTIYIYDIEGFFLFLLERKDLEILNLINKKIEELIFYLK